MFCCSSKIEIIFRPVADVDVYVYPMNPDNLPKEAKEVVKSLL